MAREKKIVKYAPQTKMPAPGYEWRILDRKDEYASLSHVISLLEIASTRNGDVWLPNTVKDRMASGYYTETGWKDTAGKYQVKRIYNRIWPFTPEYKIVNDAFMAEYDSREDLQELYSAHSGDRYFLYDQNGTSYDAAAAKDKGYDKRPACYTMYLAVINGTEAASKAEIARPTPYQEGDIVTLRKSAVGRRYVDPLFQWGSTPDASEERVGTVMLVKDVTKSWRSGKGSKCISVLWIGKDEPSDIEERHLKWMERPTFKNGLKVRE